MVLLAAAIATALCVCFLVFCVYTYGLYVRVRTTFFVNIWPHKIP